MRSILLLGATLMLAHSKPLAAQPVGGTVAVATLGGADDGRRYTLFVPAGYDAGRPAPLVVALHGCTQDAADLARGTRLNEHAAREGWLVVYPEQPEGQNAKKCWNWYDPAHQRRDAGEPGEIAAVAREVMASHAVDPDRVYVVGISAGGAMAAIVAAAYPELFTAAAAHSGIPLGAAGDVTAALAAMQRGPAVEARHAVLAATGGRTPPSLLVIQGDDDPVVNAANADALARQWRAAIERAESRRLTEETVDDARDGGRRDGHTRWSSGDEVRVELWRIAGLGHAWAGGSVTGTFTDPAAPDATRAVVDFFRAHAGARRGAAR